MAEILGCSTATIHSIESGRLKLSKNLATKIVHETQISPKWLLSGDVNAPPISAKDEPYTSKIFDRAQVDKIRRDHPGDHILLFEEIGFCAMLAAILENAHEKRSYFMANYKISQALQSLRNEFGQDLQAYPSIDPQRIILWRAVLLLNRLTRHAIFATEAAEEIVTAREKIAAAQVKPPPSKRSSRVRKRRA
jgi:DNA-binding XRE family transcriptional regulator